MSTKLRFLLSADGTEDMALNLEHSLLFPDTWDDNNGMATCVVGASGNVDSSDGTKLICHSGPPGNLPCVTLLGASWAIEANKSGRATVDLPANQCPTDWIWKLVSKS